MYRLLVLMAFTTLVSQVSAQGLNREIVLRNPSANTITLRPPTSLANYTLFFPGTAPGLGALMYTHNTTGGSSWLTAGTTNSVLQMVGGIPTWQAPSTGLDDDFVRYNLLAPQSLATTTGGNFLFNVQYGTTNAASAAGARINSVTTAANSTATGLTTIATATGTGTSMGVDILVSGGANATALRTDASIASGTTTTYKGLEVSNANISGGILANQFGIDIDPLSGATTNTAFRYNHATSPFVITGDANVGIGIAAPSPSKLRVNQDFAPSVSSAGHVMDHHTLTYGPSVAQPNQIISAMRSTISVNPGAISPTLPGMYLGVDGGAALSPTAASGTQDSAMIAGVRGFAVNVNTTQTAPSLVGVLGYIGNFGPTTNATSFQTVLAVDAGEVASNITNYRGLYVTDVSVKAGTLTNAYGVDIDYLTQGSNNTAFRYNHPAAPVVIQGSGWVGIGTSSPSTSLDVDGGLVVRPPTTISVGVAGNITVGNRSYIRVQPTANVNVGLAAGSAAGHVLIVEVLNNGGNQLTFVDNAAQNLDLSGGANFSPNNAAVITFIWNGSIWMEVSRTVNN